MFRMCYFSLCANSKLVHAEIFQWSFISDGGFVAQKPVYYSLDWDQQKE